MSELKIVSGLVAAVILTASGAFADRPLIIDDADPLDFRQFKIESGTWYENDAGGHSWDWPLNLGYGLIPSMEVNLGLGGQRQKLTKTDEKTGQETENGIQDLTLNAKWQFLKESTWIPRQAIAPTVKFPTADKDKGLGSGKMDYDLTWIASKSLSEKMGAHVNVGYSFIGKSSDENIGDILHYGMALDYQIIGPLQWVGEIYAAKELIGGTDNNVMCNTGLRWNAIDTLILDAAVGARLAGDGPYFTATTGLTWTFGFTNNKQQEKK